jgi:hypothetical protein
MSRSARILIPSQSVDDSWNGVIRWFRTIGRLSFPYQKSCNFRLAGYSSNCPIPASKAIICNVSDPQKVHCHVHGLQDQTFVCQHIAQSLHAGIPVGFCWSAEQTDERPDAWCSACEEARIDAGGDWTPEVEQKLGIKLLCGSCYDDAKSIWVNGRKIRQ